MKQDVIGTFGEGWRIEEGEEEEEGHAVKREAAIRMHEDFFSSQLVARSRRGCWLVGEEREM